MVGLHAACPNVLGHGSLLRMRIASIEVTIEGGKITPVQPHLLPEQGRGWLTLSLATPAQPLREVSIEIAEDGLPVIRAKGGGVITSEMVREIEGSVP